VQSTGERRARGFASGKKGIEWSPREEESEEEDGFAGHHG